MTRAGTRIAIIAAAAVLGAGSLGCGFISQVKQTAENVSALTDLADLLGKSNDLTFTADYKLDDGSVTQVVRQPPSNAAYIGKEQRFILTADTLTICQGAGAKATCQQSPAQAQAAAADQSAYIAAVGGGGFISAEMAVALIGASAIIPGVKIDKSEKKVGGLDSTCARVTGIPEDNQPNSVTAKEYTVCVGSNGVLTQFTGVGTDDKKLGVELVKFSDKVDAKAFATPAGAKVVKVDTLQPPN